MAIDRNRNFIAVAQYFHSIPFTARLLDLVRTAKTFFIPPRIPPRAIKASDCRSLGYAVHGEICAIDNQNIPGAAFDNLSFNRFRPDLIFSATMDQNSAVTRIRLPRRPSFVAPLEFGN